MFNTVNYEVKGQLAKLLATEDLIIENRKVPTAQFDVQRRVLTLPLWERASGTVYDLLVGHEVGHALYTPPDNWKTEYPDLSMSFVNILEDVRVEKLMKRKYPGLNKTFYSGYSQLSEQDFFDLEGEDVEDFILPDRINLYYKIGNFFKIEFQDDEVDFRDRAYKTETFEDVLSLAKEISDYLQSQQERIEQAVMSNGSLDGSIEPSGEMTEDERAEMFYDECMDNAGIENYPPLNGDGDKSGESVEKDIESGSVGGEHADGLQTVTDKRLEDNLEQLNAPADAQQEPAYCEIPKLNMDTVIVDNSEIHEYLSDWYLECQEKFSKESERPDFNIFSETDNEYKLFRKSAQKEVNYLVKEFECRKSADAYARATTARTGVIDTSKLHTYKYNEDIFRKITTIPDGKDHGLIFILDWSGSMNGVLMDTFKQLYNLIWFCKKIQIPFEVYAFTNEWRRSEYNSWDDKFTYPKPHHERQDGFLLIEPEFSMLKMITSEVKSGVLEDQMRNLWRLVSSLDYETRYATFFQYPSKLSLSGTPLNEALVSLNQIIPDFRKRSGVQKIQCITLTDGEAHPLKYNVMVPPRYEEGEEYMGARSSMNGRTYIRDRVSGRTFYCTPSYHGMTSAVLAQLRGRFTNVNFIGIRVLPNREASNFVRKYCEYDITKIQSIILDWKKNKSCCIKDVGYHAYFALSSTHLNNDSEFEVKEDATKAQIKSAFKKSLSAKKMNKKVLGEFMELIA